MKTLASRLTFFTVVVALIFTNSAKAIVYKVDRSFTNGFETATLTGTVDVPVGHYVIDHGGPHPFTSVNLTLNVNGDNYDVPVASTNSITDNGQFIIDATLTNLTFNTANADGFNPANLEFRDDTFLNYYFIGTDGNPGFELAVSDQSGEVLADVTFPVIWGTAIPEPSSLTLVALAMLGLGLRRRR